MNTASNRTEIHLPAGGRHLEEVSAGRCSLKELSNHLFEQKVEPKPGRSKDVRSSPSGKTLTRTVSSCVNASMIFGFRDEIVDLSNLVTEVDKVLRSSAGKVPPDPKQGRNSKNNVKNVYYQLRRQAAAVEDLVGRDILAMTKEKQHSRQVPARPGATRVSSNRWEHLEDVSIGSCRSLMSPSTSISKSPWPLAATLPPTPPSPQPEEPSRSQSSNCSPPIPPPTPRSSIPIPSVPFLSLPSTPIAGETTVPPLKLQPEATESSQPPVEIEIAPGVFSPLRGSQETLDSINRGSIQHVTCCMCVLDLVCVATAEYVLCPDCRVVSPAGGQGPGVGLGLRASEAPHVSKAQKSSEACSTHHDE